MAKTKIEVYGGYGKCPFCESERLNKAGFKRYPTLAGTVVQQRYHCLDCHKYTVHPVQQLEMALCTG